MRELTLLCLVGFILTVPLYHGGKAPTSKAKRSPLSRRPFEGTNGTTNSSVVTADNFTGTITHVIPNTGQSGNVVVQWNGTIRAIESDFGFPPAELEEDTEAVHHNISAEATVKEDAVERP